MSKTKGTTKIATVVQFWADFGDEVVACGSLQYAHTVGEGSIKIETTRGWVNWTNLFSEVEKGDKVVLRKLGSLWVCTGRA
jgi:hypothetical protein